MGLNLKRYIKNADQLKDCEHTKDVASRYGIQVVCDEADLQESQPVLHISETEECKHAKEIACKYGMQVICDDAADTGTEEVHNSNESGQ